MDNLNDKRKDPFPEESAKRTPAASSEEDLARILMEDWSHIPGLSTEPEAEKAEEIPAEEEDILWKDEEPAEEATVEEDANMQEEASEEVWEEADEEEVPEKADIVPSEESVEEPEEESEEPSDEDEEPPRKIRPRRKKGYGLFGLPHIASTIIWLGLILAIGVSLGRTLWVCCADVMAFGKENMSVTITITEEDDIDSISKKLGEANLVRYPSLFKFFATITGKDKDIDVGTFTLNARLDYNAMINAMYTPSKKPGPGEDREVVTIMFPEGYNCAQIFKLLEERGVCSVRDLEDYAAEGELQAYWFLEGVPRGSKYCLEGYLAPDTYNFYKDDSPRWVLEKFLDEFDDRFTDLMKEEFTAIQKTYADRLRAAGFGETYIEEHKLTVHQVVTLASIIEKETSSDDECYEISAVFYNRLVNPNIMNLGADATVYYALGDYFWEIKELTAEHLNVDSPYNTRKYKGIPPGPICNMGVQALYSALEPNAESKYLYFVYDPKAGKHRFAATLEEHNKNLEELGY